MTTDPHRVFIEVNFLLRCGSCGATFGTDEIDKATAHVLDGGPKVLMEQDKPMYPCKDCDRSFTAEGWLARHRQKVHHS